jgi:hypothetical protein
MRRRLVAKGNIHRSDYLRAVVTDTMPGDIPIIISNDGLYRNLKRDSPNLHWGEYVTAVMTPTRSYTVPYRYNIFHGTNGTRGLSLAHPAAQRDVATFYRSYGNLICYHCRKSPASIRSPEAVGSLFFVRGAVSEKNKLKGAAIDTVEIAASVSNPASYFSYRGYNRAYEFFHSTDYLRLEKKYSTMYFADISKCFNSIYTHTIFWATTDVETAKDNTSSASLSNSFDKLMQSMNYNETNGICIGAEVSRVFAEIIFSEIDRDIIETLKDTNLNYRSQYEFRRYVDDFYIFAEDATVASRVLSAVEVALAKFNLHLNNSKTIALERPFITPKARLVRDTNDSLEAFFSKFLAVGYDAEGSYVYPTPIWRSESLLRSLLDSIKCSCFDHKSGYENVSNYVIGALAIRVGALVNDFPRSIKHEGASLEQHMRALVLLLEAIYFFYNVHPSIPSSLRVAQAAIQAARLIEREAPDRRAYLGELLVRWTFQFVRGWSHSSAHREAKCVPLEALNILLVLGEVGRNDALAQKAILEYCGSVKSLNYFEIVTFLFCTGNSPGFTELRDELVERARKLILSGAGARVDSLAAHLSLDLLTCPHLDISVRGALFAEFRQSVGLGKISTLEAQDAVRAFESESWFVNWREADLLRMIRKKELSQVY